jgi:dehydrogenase/reductase SDR family member 7B
VAKHILKATQKRKRELIITFQGKLVVFLNKWFPAMMDKIVYNHMAKEPNSPFKCKMRVLFKKIFFNT